MKARYSVLTLVSTLALALASCGVSPPVIPPDKITVQLAWQHEALFAGFYAADQQGYYAEENLEVTLLPRATPEEDIISKVVSGTADFGIDYGPGLISARSHGNEVTAIATLYRRHPLTFMTLAESGITWPQDFPGHTIRTLVPGSSAVAFQALMARLGLDPACVRQVEVGFDLAPFLSGEVDIWPGFVTNEVLSARSMGYELNLIFPEDYGIHIYGYTLFAADRLIQERPDLELRFLRATLRGWQYAVENPDQAGPLALQYDPTLTEAHQVAEMEASAPLIHTGKDHIGWMRSDVWEGMYAMMLEQGLIEKEFDVRNVYTMRFLNEIYGSQ
jgi:NitT/TauT family transport system substrate-binding protein